MRKSVGILRDHLQEHPAVRAWSLLQHERLEPNMIGVIKEWKGGRRKSAVYRLAGVGPGGSAVIAKRCPPETAAIERPIYEDLLHGLPLRTLEYYGSVEESDGQSCWLFLEEATGDFYSPENPQHRALAARWLAAFHNAGRRGGWEKRVPDRSPGHYLELLRSCRVKMRECLENTKLPPEGAAVLGRLCHQFDMLESHWSELVEICQALPFTLIHGDFGKKNLLVYPATAEPQLLVFDWEFAGWGAPAVDLTQDIRHVANPDLAVYRSFVEDMRSEDAAMIPRLAACGVFFRLIDSTSWSCAGLVAGPPELLVEPISELHAYCQSMVRALSEAGWTS